MNHKVHVNFIFTNPKLSAVKLFFFQGCQLNAKMAANSNALILGYPLYRVLYN